MMRYFLMLLVLLWASPAWAEAGKFTEQEVQFTVGQDTVYGTLALPAGASKAPAVVLISGSGPTDRDGNSRLIAGKVDSHRWLAQILAEAGIASLRFDKLFIGKTGKGMAGKDPSKFGFDSAVATAVAAFQLLQARPEVDREHIGVLGHSEGGLIALVLAKQCQPAAVALLAPLSKPYLRTLCDQVAGQWDRAQAAGQCGSQEAQKGKQEMEAICQQIKSKGTLPAQMRPEYQALFSPNSLYFLHTVAAYDPRELIAGLPATMPITVLAAEFDAQVPSADVKALALAGKRAFYNVPKANHVFKHVEKPRPNILEDYGDPKLAFAPEAKEVLLKFFKESLKGAATGPGR